MEERDRYVRGDKMPELGQVQSGKEIGRTAGKYIWHACVDCGRGRWVGFKRIKEGVSLRCHKCANNRSKIIYKEQLRLKCPHYGPSNPRWAGGRTKTVKGYVLIKVKPDNFFYPMANQGYIPEHRLIMAQHLQRCLLPWEIVHHRNGIKDDNRLDNLRLIKGEADHVSFDILQRESKRLQKRIEQLEQRVTLLEAENSLLKGMQNGVSKETS